MTVLPACLPVAVAVRGHGRGWAPEKPATAPRAENSPQKRPQALLTKNANPGRTLPVTLPIPGENGIPKNAIVHGTCKQWWTGEERSHAGCCCRTFTSLTAFDRHRKGGRCNDPATVGLVARQKPYGELWGLPGPDGGYAGLHAPQEDA